MTPLKDSTITFARLLRIFAGFLLGVFVLTYVLFQARNLLLGPSVILEKEPILVYGERTIILEGIARNIVSLNLNGREIHTDENGLFNEQLVLENGYTIMTLRAQDRYGRVRTLSREFVYKPTADNYQ